MRRFLLLVALLASVAACSKPPVDYDELGAKREYSILQGLEYDNRTRARELRCIAIARAYGTEYSALGFPRADADRGYVWFITNPSGARPLVKRLGDQPFLLAPQTLRDVERHVAIAPAVRQYLSQRLTSPIRVPAPDGSSP